MKKSNLYTKQRASFLLRKAVSMGKRKKKPCKVCKSLKSEGHHPDYSKPLMVMWLCRKHHAIWHKENGFPKGKEVLREFKGHLKEKRDDMIDQLKLEGWSTKEINIIFGLKSNKIISI